MGKGDSNRKLSDEDRAEIVRLYKTQLDDGTWMGVTTIARRFGVTNACVQYHLKRAGVTMRSAREAHSGGKRCKPVTNLPVGTAPLCKCGCAEMTAWNQRKNRWNVYVTGHRHPAAPYKTEAWLRTEYIDRNQTLSEIAAAAGVGRSAITYYMCRFDIPRRDRSASRIERKVGNLNASWKGGVTPERQRLYKSPRWKAALAEVFARDGYRCVRCAAPKTRKRKLHAHHIKPFASCEEGRFDVGNMVTLGDTCHHWVHSRDNVESLFLAE